MGQTHPRAHGTMEGAGSCFWPPGGDTCPMTLSCWGDLKFPRINAGAQAGQAVARMFSAPQSCFSESLTAGSQETNTKVPLPPGPQRGAARGRVCPRLLWG